MDFRTMITQVRVKMGDTAVRIFPEHEIIFALNEGKDELVKIIRDAKESYFEDTATGTISSTISPNASTITLPSDFAQLRMINITNSGLEDVAFQKMSQSDPRFQRALMDGGSFGGGMGIIFYDFSGKSTMVLSPGADIDLGYKMSYIKTVSDMTLPADTPTEIPSEHHGFIVTWAICECMRKIADKRLQAYESKLQYQRDTVIGSVNMRQVKEPIFVTGF